MFSPIQVCCFPDNSPESDRRDLLTERDTMKQLKQHPHTTGMCDRKW